MKIILNNGKEVSALTVTGGPVYAQGANRDSLTFVLPDGSLDEADKSFTAENCKSINIITNDNTENIHNGYVIRTELAKKAILIKPATENEPEVTEMRIMVTMAQRTYAESQMAIIAEEVTNTQLALCEVYEMMA